MFRTGAFCAGAFALLGLSGCVEDTGMMEPMTETRSVSADSPEGMARANCVAALRRDTQSPDIRVVNSAFSEAGTEVNLLVNGTAQWRCIGYRDGGTVLESQTDEGAL